ncbi:MAG: SpoIIE family protein phosphatase [Simkaniaceae bacterium]
MTHKITPNKFRGSLIKRILGVVTLFLVIPFVLYTIYTAHQDYKKKIQEIIVSLDYLERSEIFMLDELILTRFQDLDMISYFFKKGGEVSTDQLPKFYSGLFGQKKNNEILFLDKQGTQYICTASSDPRLLKANYTSIINQATPSEKKYLLFAGHDPVTGINSFYMGKVTDEGIWMLIFPANRLIKALSILQNPTIPTTLSILDKNKRTIMTTDGARLGKQFGEVGLKLQPFSLDASTFFIQGERRIALLKRLPETSYYLLFDVDHAYALSPVKSALIRLLVLFALVIVVGFMAFVLISRRIARPLIQLTDVMKAQAAGERHARFVFDRFGYEINQVGETFNSMMNQIIEEQSARQRIEVEKQGYQKELLIGRALQKQLLPEKPPHLEGLEMLAHFIPAKEVSGDFYDWVMIDKNCLQMIIADVSGKGIDACFYALILRSFFRSLAHEPLKVQVEKANQLFCQDTLRSGSFATLWIGQYNLDTHELTYTSCGHNPPLLYRQKDEMSELQTEGIALGVQDGIEVEIKTISIEESDLICLYTDGLVESHNLKNECFGMGRLKTFLSNRKGVQLPDLLGDLLEEVALFNEGAPLHDDLTLLLFNREKYSANSENS